MTFGFLARVARARMTGVVGLLMLVCVVGFGPAVSQAALTYTGVNLAGADFGEGNLPGTYNVHYTYPTSAEVDYFVDKGMNVFRIPFRWERLQQAQNAPLDATELGRLKSIVNYATGKGAHVVLDPHNYARYFGNVIGTPALPNASFDDFWKRVADEFKDNDHVIFGLMNEPNSMPTEQWADAAQDAIDEIRETGATNLILVPGNAWTGAHSWEQNWYGTPNANVMDDITDPGNNFAFDVHQYLDSDSSGGSSFVVSPTIGVERLEDFTEWAQEHGRRGFLGEFAAANSAIGGGGSQIGDEAITNMINYMEDNDDVWLGFTWWAAGPWWGDYLFTMEPTNLGQMSEADRPSMDLIEPFLAGIEVGLVGDYNGNNQIDAADYTVWRDAMTAGATTLANDPTPGTVDESDFLYWRDHFGQSLSSGAGAGASAAVPEPSTLAMLLMATVATLCRRDSALTNPLRGT